MTPEQHRAFAVEFIRQAITETTQPVKPTWAERRIKELEEQVVDLYKLAIDGDVNIGGEDGPKFWHRLGELAEDIGFDADEYREQGFDRGDI